MNTPDTFYIDIFNHLPAMSGTLDGAGILQRAISGRVKYFETILAKEARPSNLIPLEHGRPIRFGPDLQKGVMLDGQGRATIVNVADVGEDRILIHDEKRQEPGLAFMLSCFIVKPAAATILAISFVFVNFIMQNIPYFRDLQHWFLTYHLNIWLFMFSQPIPWWKIGESLSILFGFNLTFLVIGVTAFQVRDIKS